MPNFTTASSQADQGDDNVSNFDFLNNSQYLNLPGCRVLYENAVLAENAYFSDHQECAVRVRVVLAQFCILVSELKQVRYPDTVFWMGSYWNQQNRYEFIQNFGNQNASLIWETYAVAESFLNRERPKREDIYPQMLKNVFLLLLWLYRELGMKTGVSEHDYSVGKIPADPVSKAAAPEIVYSTGQMLDALKIFFPDCNTEKVCSVRRAGDKYLVTDLKGELILEEMEVPETAFFSEGKAEHLRSRMKEIKREFDLKTREFVQSQSACDKQIVLLELQIEESEKEAAGQVEDPEQEIAKLEEEKQENAKTYRETFGLLAQKFDEVKEKLDDLLPAEQKKSELQEQMKKLLKQRADLEETFLADQGRLLADVREAETELENTVRSLTALNLSGSSGEALTGQMRLDLLEKRLSLESACKQAQKEYELSQKESSKVIGLYKNVPNNVEVIRILLLAGNLRFQRLLDGSEQAEETRGRLQVIREEIGALDEGLAAYRQNLSDPEITACFARVKEQYENRNRELLEGLRQRAEEFAWEKKRYEGLLNTLGDVTQESAGEPSTAADERIFVDTEIAQEQLKQTNETRPDMRPDMPPARPSKQQRPNAGWLKWIIAAIVCLVVGLLISFLIYQGILKKIEKGRSTEQIEAAVWLPDEETVMREDTDQGPVMERKVV